MIPLHSWRHPHAGFLFVLSEAHPRPTSSTVRSPAPIAGPTELQHSPQACPRLPAIGPLLDGSATLTRPFIISSSVIETKPSFRRRKTSQKNWCDKCLPQNSCNGAGESLKTEWGLYRKYGQRECEYKLLTYSLRC